MRILGAVDDPDRPALGIKGDIFIGTTGRWHAQAGELSPLGETQRAVGNGFVGEVGLNVLIDLTTAALLVDSEVHVTRQTAVAEDRETKLSGLRSTGERGDQN